MAQINFDNTNNNHTARSVVLSVQNLTKIYKKRIAVDNVSFNVYEGEIFGFLGPNGAGKSTTIKMITGLASMSDGDVKICGKSIKNDFSSAIRNVGAIVEMPELYSYMTGRANLKYFASLYPNIDQNRINDVAELVGLENRLDDKFKKYSLGMKQRLGIAQALLHNPKILILDEPTNGLDPAGIHEMRDFLKKLAHKDNIAIVVSSHILGEMEQLCDTIAIIDKGKLIEVKSIDEIRHGLASKQRILFKVDYPNYAGKIIYKRFGSNIEVLGQNVYIAGNDEMIPLVTALLVEQGISIYGITTELQSLEDVFIDIINQKSTFKIT